jgi:hypothetical protein
MAAGVKPLKPGDRFGDGGIVRSGRSSPFVYSITRQNLARLSTVLQADTVIGTMGNVSDRQREEAVVGGAPSALGSSVDVRDSRATRRSTKPMEKRHA